MACPESNGHLFIDAVFFIFHPLFPAQEEIRSDDPCSLHVSGLAWSIAFQFFLLLFLNRVEERITIRRTEIWNGEEGARLGLRQQERSKLALGCQEVP